jgi:acetylornithine deacetylase/succinyl-diaminopimelate desuccinylase-like protein
MKIDWDQMERETVARLQRMIRFDTTNPPGNELPLARQLADELEREGLKPQVLVSREERGSLAVRLEGDGSMRPVLLLSHLDVVPAEPERWTHPPFSGEVADGFVWGRGAIDCKLIGAVGLQVLLMCRRLGLPLKRDLMVVATGDEEYGGKWGAGWLAEHYPELFDAEFGINEGGGFALLVDGHPLYTCQVGEKGSAPLDLIAYGRSGHSSVPHNENPIFGLGRALERLGREKMPHRVTGSVRAFFERAAAVQSNPEVAGNLRGMLAPDSTEAALARLPVNESTRLMFDAMVRNTCAPTVLEAGVKRNVIPSTATVQLSGRPLPGMTEKAFLSEVREIVGEEVKYRMEMFRPGLEFDHETPLFRAIEASMQRWDPEGVVIPYMQTGGTDARFLTGRDITMYGFVPMRYEPGLDFFDLCHGHDERVSLENVRFGVQVLFDVVCRLNEIET